MGLTVGLFEGLNVGETDGLLVGDKVGLTVGLKVGLIVGLFDGDNVGETVGLIVGDFVGDSDGEHVGDIVGDFDGLRDGESVGLIVGDIVGAKVGLPTIVTRISVHEAVYPVEEVAVKVHIVRPVRSSLLPFSPTPLHVNPEESPRAQRASVEYFPKTRNSLKSSFSTSNDINGSRWSV